MERILIVDDDQEIRDFLADTLSDEGFGVRTIGGGGEVNSALQDFSPDILLLDYRMPGQSGVDVMKNLRSSEEHAGLPVIMVTGVDGEEEKLAAFELGADDYVVKPFLPRELAARIRAVLRRAQSATVGQQSKDKISSAGLLIDLRSHRVHLRGEEVYLTLTEFRILVELLRNDGAVLSRDDLRSQALGNLNVTDRTIDVHMASLRKKLPEHGACIGTVRGVGYRYDSRIFGTNTEAPSERN